MPHHRISNRLIIKLVLLLLSINDANGLRSKRQSLFFDRVSATNATCYTKDGDEGQCIEATKCKLVNDILAKNPSPAERELLKEGTCRIVGVTPYFCCPSPTTDPAPVDSRFLMSTTGSSTTPPTTTTELNLLNIMDIRIGGRGMSLAELQNVCGVSNDLVVPKILAPTRAIANSWIWMAAIFLNKMETVDATEVDCDGVLISDFYVLTSAQCVFSKGDTEKRSPSEFTVRLGDLAIHTNQDGVDPVDFNVIGITPHPDFRQNPIKNDIALLRLSKPVDISKSIAPICLPTEEIKNQSPEAMQLYTSFWKKSEVYPTGIFLEQVPLKVQNNTHCQTAYESFEIPIEAHQLCAEYKRADETNCQSGSGEPLMSQWKGKWHLIGTSSIRQHCIQSGLPGIYVEISEYKDWIIENARLQS